ncbi:MAG: RNase adapter RapZ [Candidatus Aminicenantes bacterium]|nr:RNase adapter RapZ [Candidatus Aminicenantes bacterium]
MVRADRFLIITGLSGSGKSVASRFLEDLGYYCVDNLPAKLIPVLVDLWRSKKVEIPRLALVVDIREHGFLEEFPKVWRQIKKRVSPRLIFLDASDETLVKRFGESRRPHPLAGRRSVLEGVKLERRRLERVRKTADEVIDTTATPLPALKALLAARFLKSPKGLMRIMVVSFGYKYGLPLDSDLVFDARFLPNPFYVERLKRLTGLSRRVREFVLQPPAAAAFLAELRRFLAFLLPLYVEEGKTQLRISVGCTGGRHRSVVIAEELASTLRTPKYDINIDHRDLRK